VAVKICIKHYFWNWWRCGSTDCVENKTTLFFRTVSPFEKKLRQ